MLFRRSALSYGDDVIELNLVILKLFSAVLTTIIISSNYAHHCREIQCPSTNSPFILRFSHDFCSKEYWTYMSEILASSVSDLRGYLGRMLHRV